MRLNCKSCHFTVNLATGDMLCDRLVVGINGVPLQGKLLAEKMLTYKSAFEMAQSWEVSLQDSSLGESHNINESDSECSLFTVSGKITNTYSYCYY